MVETTASDFLKVLSTAKVSIHHYLRRLHNLALGLGWIASPILPTRLWPKVQFKEKRAVTKEEHKRILEAERNPERNLFYQLLWEIGASQSDAACLRAEQIDWRNRTLSYRRKKTGEWAHIMIGRRLEGLLMQFPKEGELFPAISQMSENARAAEFYRRCKLLGIRGISLHSYRYAWAQRARSLGYGKIRQLYELLEPDDFLMPHRADFVWLSKLYMVYRKKFYPLDKFETSEADGAKTRELIRDHIDAGQIKDEFPTYVLDENYLTKLKDIEPDSKALDIEAMLAAELKIRVDEDPQAEALSEKLKRIIDAKRNDALAGVALISALEGLAAEVVDLVNESKKPVGQSIAEAARTINPAITEEQATAIAAAITVEAHALCFPNWHLKSDVKSDLFLAITRVLVQQFKNANLHMPATGFAERAMRLLEKTRYVGKADEDSAS